MNSDRDRAIIKAFEGGGKKLNALAKEYGLTPARVWQITHPKPKENLRALRRREVFAALDAIGNSQSLSPARLASLVSTSPAVVKHWMQQRGISRESPEG